jgi:hypothetical protein
MFLQCMLLPNQWQVQDIYNELKASKKKETNVVVVFLFTQVQSTARILFR